MSRYNPTNPHASAVFNAVQQFAQRCLIGQESLMLPNQPLWTSEHFGALRKYFIEQPDTSDKKFFDKLSNQLAPCQPLDIALMAELFWILEIGPNNMYAKTKVAKMKAIWEIKPPAPFPSDSPFLRSELLEGLGSAGVGYLVYLPHEITFAIKAFGSFIDKPVAERTALLSDATKFSEWLDGVPEGKGRQFYNVFCHLLFPDSFERIFSQGDKNKVARKYDVETVASKLSRPALDAALLTLRERLEIKYPGQVDYYVPPVGPLIKETPATPDIQANQQEHIAEGITGAQDAPDLTEITTPPLRTADNLILFGPPGTGKTYSMQQLMKKAFDAGEDYTFVAFHPSYAYEDFMGGLRPTAAIGGALAVSFQKGPFMLLCEKAHSRPTEHFTLFIDEINRANVAKVFGELITLIEPSKRVIAGSKPTDERRWITLPYTNEPFSVPDNLDIVATMNTADRSISMLDIALRRRFRFQECPPDPSLIDPPTVGNISLPALLSKINDRLEYLLDRDHQIGHALFMDIHSLTQLQDIIAQRVIPLLQEYFFEDTARASLVLTGKSYNTVFFKTRKLAPEALFPGGRSEVGADIRISSALADPRSWNEAEIMRLYSNDAALKQEIELGGTLESLTLSDEPSTVG